jgi:YD repeat-containing protein
MKKSLIILVAATWALLPTACKKESTSKTDNGSGNATTCLVTSLDGGAVNYDAQNRITSFSTDGQSASYTYNGSKVVIAISGDSMNATAEFNLNSMNYPATGKISTVVSGLPITINYTYTYNADGRCTKAKQSLAFFGQEMVTVTDYEYTNGNLTKETSYDEATPEEKDVIAYTYLSDKTDSRALSMSKVFIADFQGKGSTNLIKNSTSTTFDGTVTIINYTYEYDASGKVTKETQTDSDSGEINGLSTYGYTCK